MRYSSLIFALFMIVGIGFSANLRVNGQNFYVTATTTYDWSLVKSANRTDLKFIPPPDPEPESVRFTIDITRSAPYSEIRKIGSLYITNLGPDPETITRVVDSVRYHDFRAGRWHFLHEEILFSGSYIIGSGATWTLRFNFPFTTPYDISGYGHWNFFNVYTADGGCFKDSSHFHTRPRVVNETLHIWDEITVPSGFNYSWDYNGPWTLHGSGTFIINLALTNQSAGAGTYQVVNTAFGSNECGLWSDTVVIYLHVIPDRKWQGSTFTPGYWKNHPEAFIRFLPVTIAGITVTSVSQAISILNRPNDRKAWDKFLCHFLATTFNTRYDPGLLNAYYNDMSQSGEFMEGQTVAYICSVANTYRSNTPRATLLAMKDVLDAINNNETTNVLWLTPSGGQGSTVSFPTPNLITLHPNPFSDRTEIRFQTEVKEPTKLQVYNLSGTKVRDLIKSGNSPIFWDGTDNLGRKLTKGVYILKLENGDHRVTLKALICR